MTTVSVTIPAHNEYLDDGTAVAWPAATLTAQPGYFIYCNRGTSTSYTADLPYLGTSYDTLTFGGTLASGTATGTFTDRNGNTCYYAGVYCAFPSGTPSAPATDMTDDGFADCEEYGFIDPTKDDNGEYPVTTPSGQVRVLAQHLGTKAVRKRHAARSHTHKHVWHGVVFQPQVVDASNTYVMWSAGTVREEGSNVAIQNPSGTPVNIVASSTSTSGTTNPVGPVTSGTPPMLHAFNNQHIIFNNSGSTIATLLSGGSAISIPDQYLAAVDSYDHTDPTMDEVYWVGQVAPAPDTDSGAIWIHGHHTNSHTMHGIHLADKSVHPAKLNSVQGGVPLENNAKVLAPNGSGEGHWELLSNIAGFPSVPVMQYGSVGLAFGGNGLNNAAVSLSGFTTTPIVLVALQDVSPVSTGSFPCFVFAHSVSTTGFTLEVVNQSGSAISVTASWLAIGT